ncbi:ATG8-interacting protein 1-like isoform X1 [Hordeum vulgare subsp. vulgare]|nr:ATG8-interacting protein 1-like isoform X1 [Hordeum vulgare subsp. vulgare]XP_044971159.1 ATG8-interacting protein 1-like isoform X1 [Hordeum vulgare subsp. vulgare]
MSDSEKEVPATDGAASRGADWEVVTLTASTYAAAPGGPQGAAEGKRLGEGSKDSQGTLLMSDHFVFPPSEHENLPIETALLEPQESTSVDAAAAAFKNVGGGYDDDGSETVKYYDEGKSLSVHDAEMMMGDVAEFYAEDDGRGFVVFHDDDSQDKSGAPQDTSGSSKGRGSGAPCQCWLKKHMSCLYDQAKETNTIWGAVVVAALVGLVILWRKDKLHMSCLKWRSRSAVSLCGT